MDDLSHVLVAKTNNELERKLLEAGRIVGREVNRLSLTLSEKSKLIPETPSKIKVAKQLAKEGIPINTDDTADDVGVQQAGGAMRVETTLNDRIFGKGAPRARRIRGLVMVNAEAKKLAMPGVQPTQSYGHVSMGASKVQQMAM